MLLDAHVELRSAFVQVLLAHGLFDILITTKGTKTTKTIEHDAFSDF